MPKSEVGTNKWLGNKIKAKGLQKLRWYCQMCQKQCRDENGFKCHRMSEGHQRQMQIFVQDPNKFMDEFSQEFEVGFMKLMQTRYCQTRILANSVYCEFIADRHHTHMNSTIWVTLSNFVQYLGRTGQCKIDRTPKGWYLEYIDRSPEKLQREKEKADFARQELNEEERHQKRMAQAIADGKAAGGYQEAEFTELQRQEGDDPIKFAMPEAKAKAPADRPKQDPGRNALAEAFEAKVDVKKEPKQPEKRKISALDSIMEENEAKKRAGKDQAREELEKLDYWITPGLIVKVMHQDLAKGKYYKKKGRVEKVTDKYTADVRMVDAQDLIRLDQEMLETVIPNIGKPVRIVKGAERDQEGTMEAVDMKNFCCSVKLADGSVVENLEYDQLCKYEE